MDKKPLVVATRRLPRACEERLATDYLFRMGDDDANYSAEALKAHTEGAAGLLVTSADTLDATAINSLPDTIRVVATFSVGYEHIDLEAAAARGLKVCNTPGVLTAATADITLFLILAATRRAREGQALMLAGTWNGLRPTQLLGSQITGKRLGIVGMGRIGRAVASRARSFGMEVSYHNRRPVAEGMDAGASYVPSLEGLLSQSDVLSLHCPLTPETKGLLNAPRIAQLPDGAVVINTARGPLIDDNALIAALLSGKVSAAGLDVYANEPNLDQRYLTLENVFLLPHLGSATLETRTAMGMLAIDGIDAVLAGRPPLHCLV